MEDRVLLAATNPVDLATLDGTNGFRLDGIDRFDFSGSPVSSAGDVNGDGFADLIIGAFQADPGGDSYAGESYVVFGKSSGFDSALDLSTLNGTNGFRLDGIDVDDKSGRSVSSAGDVNGDGFDDLIIGANGGDPGGEPFAGQSYVVFGKSDGFGSALDLSTLDGTNGFRLDGVRRGDYSGRSVSSAGDVNGDGFGDLIIGTPYAAAAGVSYVVFGKLDGFSSALDLSTLDGTNGFRLDGIDTSDFSGSPVSSAGDVNGDGFGDLIIGAFRADPGGDSNAGESYVVFGKSGGFDSALDLSTLDGTNGFRLDGIDADDRSGYSVSSAGDVNGDGFGDLIIGAQGGSDAGESYVVFGKSGGFDSALDLSTLNGTNGFRLDGVDAGDVAGNSVSSAGDVNGDGFDDLIIGANGGDPGGVSGAGESYVVFGKLDGFSSALDLSTLDGTNGFRLDGIDTGDGSGRSVSGAGDVNGDGFGDLIIGAISADPGGVSSAGESYVVFGGNFTGGMETQVGDATANTLTANQGVGAIDILVGGQGSDTLISDGGEDVLYGGEGTDTLVVVSTTFQRVAGGNGTDTLRLDGSGLTLDLTTVADNRLTDIEIIDITGSGDNTLTLERLDVANISSTSNRLVVRRDAGDTVNIGNDWDATRIESIDGTDFVVYSSGAVRLDVEIVDDAVNDAPRLDRLDDFDLVVPPRMPVDLSERTVALSGILAGGGESQPLRVTATSSNPALIPDPTITYTSPETIGTLSFAPVSHVTSTTTITVTVEDGGLDNDLNTTADNASFSRQFDIVIGPDNPHQSDLTALDGTNGFQIEPASGGDVITGGDSAGDVNGDGFDDLIFSSRVSIYGASSGNYVVFGKSGGFSATLNPTTVDGTNGFHLTGGFGAMAAGDVNGDGVDDLMVQTAGVDSLGAYVRGAYVVFGKSGGFAAEFDVTTVDGSDGFRVDRVNTWMVRGGTIYSGVDDLAKAGDINGDGFDDLVFASDRAAFEDYVTDDGEVFVVFGKSGGFASSLDLATLDGTDGFRLVTSDHGVLEEQVRGDSFGQAIATAGDINGDGFDDLIIGAPYGARQYYPQYSDGSFGERGQSYVLFGKSGGFDAITDLSTSVPDGTNGFLVTGLDANEFGRTGGSLGDINGDGFDDLFTGGTNYGDLYATVVFGHAGEFPAAIDRLSLDGSDGFRLNNNSFADSDYNIANAGDVNGDGFDDLTIGSLNSNLFGTLASVLFGRSAGFEATFDRLAIDGVNGFDLGSDHLKGISRTAGDINGDGFDDLVITYSTNGGRPNGVNVVFGGNFTGGAETQGGTAGAETLTATQGAAIDVLVGGVGDDTLISDGGADVLRAGAGDDTLAIPDVDFSSSRRIQGGSGSDTLRLDGSGLSLDLTTTSDNRIVDVEAIDVTGSGNNSLTLDVQEVLNISSTSNTLIVRRDIGDAVSIGSGWTITGIELIDGTEFLGYSQGAAQLKVQAVNDTPALDALSDITINEDVAAQSVTVTGISAGENETQDLRVTVTSSDTGLIPNPSVTYTSPESIGSLSFTPVANQSGTATITVTVEDSGRDLDLNTTDDNLTASRTFNVTVQPVLPVGTFTPVSPDPRNAAVDSVDVTFSESVLGLDITDFTLSRLNTSTSTTSDLTAMLHATGSMSGGGTSWTVGNLTSLTGVERETYTLSLNTSGTGVVDLGGNEQVAGATESWHFASLQITQPPAEGGTLTISDDGDGDDDDLSVGIVDGQFVIQFEGTSTSVPVDQVTELVINGGDGEDTITIDLSGGPLPFDVVFNGGGNPVSGPGDTLIVTGLDAAFPAYTIDFSNATDGVVSFADLNPGGDQVSQSTLTFTGLEPVTIDGTPGNVIFNLPGSTNPDVVLQDTGGADGIMRLSGSTFEDTDFSVAPGTPITINTQSGADVITIGSLDATFMGDVNVNTGDGDDLVDTTASTSAVNVDAGDANDTVTIVTTSFQSVAGGNGTDTLSLSGSGATLDLTTIADNRIQDIEVIDITGSGNNTLTLNEQEVVNISSTSNTLLVRRNADDTVNIGAGWTQEVNQTIDSVTYDIFQQGAATLGIQDFTPPTVIVDIVDASLNNGDNNSNVTFDFSEVVTGFTVDDVTVAGGSLSAFTMVSGNSYTATFAATDGVEATGSVTVDANSYTDIAGNSGATDSDTVTIDTLNPTVTVDIVDASLNDGDNSSNVTFEFSEAVTGFAVGDVTVSGGVLSAFAMVDSNSYTGTFTASDGVETSGSMTVTASSYTDTAGNSGATGTDNVTIDTLNPTVTVSIADASLSDGDNSSDVTFTFSEAVSEFTVDDVTVSGGTLSAFTMATAASYTATFTATDGVETTGSVTVTTNSYTDIAGNLGATGTDDVTIDTFNPTAGIVDVTPDPRTTQAGIVTVNFNETVTGVDISNFSLTRDGSVVDISGQTVSGSGSSYTLDLTGVQATEGTYLLTLSGTDIVDADSNPLARNVSDTWVVAGSARTVTLPSGGGSYTVVVSSDGLSVEIQQTLPTASLIASIPISEVGTLGIVGSKSADLVTLGDLTGFAGPVIFVGNGGDDLYDSSATSINSRVLGGAGNDTFLGGSGDDNVDGGAGADSLSGGDGNDSLRGNRGNDTLAGGDGNDFLNGASGLDFVTGDGDNDTLLGGAGTDTLDGGTGDDFVNGQGGQADIVAGGGADGTDTLRGGSSDILLPGSVGIGPATPPPEVTGSTLNVTLPSVGGPFTILINATQLQITSASGTIVDELLTDVSGISLTGSGSDDVVILDATLSAFPGNVSLSGGAGNDSLDSSVVSVNTAFAGGTGNDSLTGGGGNDIFVGGDGDDFATGGAGNDALTGNEGNDNFSGGDGDDFLNGNAGHDTLFGNAGDDILLGGRNTDLLDGGDGSDVVNGQGGTGDTVAGGGGGTDSLRGDSSDTLITGPSGIDPGTPGDGGGDVVDRILTVALPAVGGSFNILVAAGQLQVTPSGGSIPLVDEVFTGISDIVINGGAGVDVVILDATLTALTGSVTFNGGAGGDSLDSSAYTGRVVFNGDEGDDTFVGGSGNDVATGAAGNDSISTGAGSDLVRAGAGNDFIDAGTDADTVFGNDGDDVLIGGAGDDILNGNSGNDTITGGDDNDTLLGGSGADSLDGGLGDDTVRGQGGIDTTLGGGGIDLIFP